MSLFLQQEEKIDLNTATLADTVRNKTQGQSQSHYLNGFRVLSSVPLLYQFACIRWRRVQMEAINVLAATAWLGQSPSTQYRGSKSSNKIDNYLTTLSCTIWHMLTI